MSIFYSTGFSKIDESYNELKQSPKLKSVRWYVGRRLPSQGTSRACELGKLASASVLANWANLERTFTNFNELRMLDELYELFPRIGRTSHLWYFNIASVILVTKETLSNLLTASSRCTDAVAKMMTTVHFGDLIICRISKSGKISFNMRSIKHVILTAKCG